MEHLISTSLGTRASSQSNFCHFHDVFNQNLAKNPGSDARPSPMREILDPPLVDTQEIVELKLGFSSVSQLVNALITYFCVYYVYGVSFQ